MTWFTVQCVLCRDEKFEVTKTIRVEAQNERRAAAMVCGGPLVQGERVLGFGLWCGQPPCLPRLRRSQFPPRNGAVNPLATLPGRTQRNLRSP